MLRLVHPASSGQATAPSKRRPGAHSPALSLTIEEVRRVRAATRAACRAYGTAAVLAIVMEISLHTVYDATSDRGKPMSGTFAIRLAKAAGVTVESILTGALSTAGRCPTCGHRVGDGRLAAGGAS